MRRGVERTRTRKLDELKETENEERSGKNKNEEPSFLYFISPRADLQQFNVFNNTRIKDTDEQFRLSGKMKLEDRRNFHGLCRWSPHQGDCLRHSG
jgi:hypothetical protein